MIELDEIIRLSAKTGFALVATAGSHGLPHLTPARRIEAGPEGHLRVTEWFCPGTMANLEHNRKVSLVVWDEAADLGYQVLGEVEEVRELSMLDGVTLGQAPLPTVPQIERALIVRVSRILDFKQAPHTDEPA